MPTDPGAEPAPLAWVPALLGCIGALVVLWANASPRLPGLHSDGVQYLEAARSLARLEAPMIPVAHWSSTERTSILSHYPPGLSVAIAIPIALGVAAPNAAALVLAASAGVTLALAYALGRWLAGAPGGLFSAALVGFYPEWVRVHTAVWSEPLYLALLLAFVLALLRRPGAHALHGGLALACTAVRYVGVSVAVLAVLAAWRGGPTGRLRRVAQAGLPTLAFLVGWTLLTAAEGGSVRRVQIQPPPAGWAGDALDVLLRWAAPRGGVGAAVVGLGLAALLLARSSIWRGARGRAFLGIALGLSALHLLVVAASRALLDPRISMDARIVLPVPILLGVAIGSALAAALGRDRAWGWLALVPVVVWVGAGFLVVREGVASFKETGQYYTHVLWERTAPVQWARAAAGGTVLYSNEPELLYLYTGVPARLVPVRGEDMEAWRGAWRRRPGPLVMMNPPRNVDLPAGLLLEGLALEPVAGSAEGVVFWRRAQE